MPRRARAEEPDIRRRLLDAAGRLLSEQGPAGLTTRRLAAEVGTSTMAVYTYFGGLPALVHEVVVEGFRRLAEHLAAAQHTDDALADLAALALAYRQNAHDNPHLYRVMFGTAPLGEHPSGPATGVGHETFEVVVEGVRRAAKRHTIRDVDPEQLAAQLWSALHGYVLLELAGYLGDEDLDTVMWSMLSRIVAPP